ncbi:MAG: hypothetical protein QW512_00390 [Thermofilaceae archaeon]
MLCPLLTTCKKQVDLDTYRNVCSNISSDEYKKCDEYRKIASTPKTPSEWSSVLTLTPR